ncbi:FMN-binding negative transcriptional regulator [Rhodoplanes roseus]|uniref:Transcriptional regulator n=1 Tax=Rhodoplanes roseus TaxID=29409 RepID=A0A327L3A4_9BRAD|nr:FMN-binding negative transcriptional regulator [Rhodoplanes roseus]RAI44664.1 transcriptional regulator [Rhodoplanes roseus]
MYVPPAFRVEDLGALHETMRAVRLANLVTATPDGLIATPLPLFLSPEEGPFGTLYGHLARANPQWTLAAAGEALALFTGPDAYVTPSWYPSKQEHGKVVPTWNYVAVHAYGPAEFFDDADRLRDVVGRLTDLHERSRSEPWAVADAPDSFVAAQLRGIIGLRLPITRLEGKRKTSQNRTPADQAGVAAGLSASDRAADRALAALMGAQRDGA